MLRKSLLTIAMTILILPFGAYAGGVNSSQTNENVKLNEQQQQVINFVDSAIKYYKRKRCQEGLCCIYQGE